MSEEDKNDLSSDERKENSVKPEIRYIPIDLQAIENEDDKINIYDLLRTLWEGRFKVIRATIVFFLAGIFISLISVEQYTSNVRLIPENNDGFSMGSLGGLAQQFGFGSSVSRQNGEQISVNLYPSIIKSNVFTADLLEYKVSLQGVDEQITIKEYLKDHAQSSFTNTILNYTVKLPLTIRKWISSNNTNNPTSVDRSLVDPEKIERLMNMSHLEWEILNKLRNNISTFLETETGIFTVSATMQEPVLAADVADEIVQMLSEHIIKQRTTKARRELEFIEGRFEEAKAEFEQSQQDLAEFNDQNRGQLTAMARTQEQLLQSRYNLNFELYNSMAQRLEEARIKLQEETPVINILEPAAIPTIRSAPKRTLIVIVFTVLGGFFGLLSIFLTPYWHKIRSELS